MQTNDAAEKKKASRLRCLVSIPMARRLRKTSDDESGSSSKAAIKPANKDASASPPPAGCMTVDPDNCTEVFATTQELLRVGIVAPDSRGKTYWDGYIAILILYR